jgi:hypothetical protein
MGGSELATRGHGGQRADEGIAPPPYRMAPVTGGHVPYLGGPAWECVRGRL